MTDIDAKFEKIAVEVKNLKARPSDEELLDLYGLFKQATAGDCTHSKPGMFQLKEKAKYEFWCKKKGMPQAEAKEAYINKAQTLIKTYGLNS